MNVFLHFLSRPEFLYIRMSKSGKFSRELAMAKKVIHKTFLPWMIPDIRYNYVLIQLHARNNTIINCRWYKAMLWRFHREISLWSREGHQMIQMHGCTEISLNGQWHEMKTGIMKARVVFGIVQMISACWFIHFQHIPISYVCLLHNPL